VQLRVVYRAVAVGQFTAEVGAALAAGDIDGVLHFSRRSAAIYLECAAQAELSDSALAPVQYCLSQQVAEPLAAAGAQEIRVVERPTEAALIELVTG
jgi:uroporphyrinogen-III synthase